MKPVGWIVEYPKMYSNIHSYQSPEIELLLTKTKLVTDPTDLLHLRQKFLVYEDNFQSVIAQAIGNQLSYADLHRSCSKYSKDLIVDHEKKSKQTMDYFTNRGLSSDASRACAFAISFYTGTNSGQVNRGASLIARRGNGQVMSRLEDAQVNNASIILYYLTLALSHIDFYWGTVTRAVDMHDVDFDQYIPGALITWIQFSSTMKGQQPVNCFRNRNTIFTIYSLTGRHIQQFSNFPEEDEVLFLPHSSFLVTHIIRDNYQNRIFLRQIELGLCEYSILWVDDHILDEHWENKRLMEKASTLGGKINVHFIPKTDTNSAIVFLQSAFGQRLKGKKNFRLVTDMYRENEHPAENAGARLLLQVRQLGFQCLALIFTMRERECLQQIEKLLNNKQQENIQITSRIELLDKFVCFH